MTFLAGVISPQIFTWWLEYNVHLVIIMSNDYENNVDIHVLNISSALFNLMPILPGSLVE